MKLKAKSIGLFLLGIVIAVGFSTELIGNTKGLLTDSRYVIPEQSSVFTFKPTGMSKDGGNYWLYGEDKNYYYSQVEKGDVEPYIKISKQQANQIDRFNKTNYLIWYPQYLCGDLLEKYAKKPKNLEFIECKVITNSQTIVRAEYKVSGGKSEEVEAFLVEKYGMGKLKWVCCGWETSGKNGGFEHEEITNAHPYYMVLINMYASGEVENENGEYVELEFDREKIEYFTVTVEIAAV